jgi:hypothetical protein
MVFSPFINEVIYKIAINKINNTLSPLDKQSFFAKS